MLRLDQLKLRQGDFSLHADLALPAGAVTAVMGPSGGGKSTLLLAIAGFLIPQSGRVIWDGVDLTGKPPGERPVSVLFQDNNLFPHLTVLQNLALGRRPSGRLSADETGQAMDLLAKVGLKGLEGRKPGSLSGGQQSRAALARVLLADRPLVLLDEPFAALGPGLRDEMLDLVVQMLAGPGRSVLLVTHGPDDARRSAASVIAVIGGAAHPPVDTTQFLTNPPPGMQDYLGRPGR